MGKTITLNILLFLMDILCSNNINAENAPIKIETALSEN